MLLENYIYTFSYDNNESELCKLESRCIFKEEEKDKILFSSVKVEPSSSAFIKKRLSILAFSTHYETLIDEIKKKNICAEGFKVEYMVLSGDETVYNDRLSKLKDIGYSIEGKPEYYKPAITFAICFSKQTWWFGILNKNNYEWKKHKQKPYSFSNAINVHIAKAVVNIALEANKERKLLDACCGVGTILLEACFAGNSIEGCDNNWKACKFARSNLAHFQYESTVHRTDIKDLNRRYDAIIIDLPYNLFTSSEEETANHIIESSARLSNRLVVVSTANITDAVEALGYKITDVCGVPKSGKTNFTRYIWVCEKFKQGTNCN